MTYPLRTILILQIVSLLAVRLTGQATDYVIHIDAYTVSDGLGSNHVLDCYQDSRGMIWLVREGGIERFDGEEFKHFELPELKNTGDMSFLLEDKDHDLWIRRNDKRILFLNIYTEKLRNSQEKFGAEFPKTADWAVAGADDSYLIQDALSNIYRFRAGAPATLYYSTPGNAVSPLVEFSNGVAWSECNYTGGGGYMVATDQQGKELAKIPYKEDHIFAKGVWGGDTIHYITKDSFYLANLSGIVLRKSLSSMIPGYVFSDPYGNGQFQKIVVEQDRGLVWLYVPYQLLVFDKSLNLRYAFDPKKYFVQSSTVFDLFADNQNHTWFCTFDGLYNINFKPNLFHQYLALDAANKSLYKPVSVRKICKATDGKVYAIASPRIYSISPEGQLKTVFTMPWSDELDLPGLDADERGNLWFANKYLYRFNVFNKKLDRYPGYGRQNWMLKRIENRVWYGFPVISTDIVSGLTSPPQIFPRFEGADRMDVYDALRKNEREWLFATNQGLYVVDTVSGQYQRCWDGGSGDNFLPVNNIRQIYQDKQGDYWMPNTDGLLYWRPGGEKKLYGAAEGIPTYCSAVLEDDFGQLWISSNFGLIQFDKKERRVLRTYFVTDGLPSDEFNRLSYFKDETTGEMYLGGINGLVRFHPRDFQQKLPEITQKANLILTECMIFSGETNQEEDIRPLVFQENRIDIHPGDLFLRIKFALTDYTRPSGIRYSYLIDGYNKNWHTGYENDLLLSGLPYGKYTLHVKAISANGFTYEKEMKILIHVWPPFYLQTWFVTLCLLLTAFSIVWYVRRRTRLLTERSAMLEQMVRERTVVIENQRQSLKELYDSKSRLYANITHEFRTPLTMIIGPVRRALKTAAGIPEPELQQNLQYILQNSEQLLGLVNQMLDLNKLESKAMQPEYRQSDILPFLEQVVEKFQHYAASREIKLGFNASGGPLIMDFDHDLLEKVLSNLLSNAVKFTPSGGRIQVRVKSLDHQLYVEVADNGKGIAPEKLPYIFERYYQADGSATRRSEGTGIGLALVKELVDLFEGKISVESKPGQGAVFTLVLPIRREAPTEDRNGIPANNMMAYPTPVEAGLVALDEGPDAEGRPIVMVIEDNPSVANFVASCLSRQYKVQAITDSRQGLAAVREQLPDLVFCDLMMPDMDGYEVCAAIKSDERTCHIPVVFLSAVTEQTERLKRLEAGADAYLSKPFREEELQAVAAGLLQIRERLRGRYLAHSAGEDTVEAVAEMPAEPLNPYDIEFLNKIKSAIIGRLDNQEFDGAELARSIGYSNSQLHRKLTALTGLPAGRYIYQVRLGVAREMLQRKDLTIAEIAYQTGFSDPAYFTKIFTRAYGQSPRKYRSDTA